MSATLHLFVKFVPFEGSVMSVSETLKVPKSEILSDIATMIEACSALILNPQVPSWDQWVALGVTGLLHGGGFEDMTVSDAVDLVGLDLSNSHVRSNGVRINNTHTKDPHALLDWSNLWVSVRPGKSLVNVHVIKHESVTVDFIRNLARNSLSLK